LLKNLDFILYNVYINVYTMEVHMITAKVFKSGNSQAVRLPKEYRLDAKEVSINRIGNVLMLVPLGDPWHVFSEGLKEIGSDFPTAISKLKNSTRTGFK
jgi:Virulence-associated protein and related proteins